MKDGIIIQARTGSTRLHNKILLPFYGEQRIIDILIANQTGLSGQMYCTCHHQSPAGRRAC